VPIKPENAKRYPKNWKAIRAAVIARAHGRCEGSPKWPDCRAINYEPHPDTGSKVVLTVAHLDHTPENCEMGNLKAWCQRCHLAYDHDHHMRNSHSTRHNRKALGELF